jgi:hypothetical protein
LRNGGAIVCKTQVVNCRGEIKLEVDKHCRDILTKFSVECGVELGKFSAIVERGVDTATLF